MKIRSACLAIFCIFILTGCSSTLETSKVTLDPSEIDLNVSLKDGSDYTGTPFPEYKLRFRFTESSDFPDENKAVSGTVNDVTAFNLLIDQDNRNEWTDWIDITPWINKPEPGAAQDESFSENELNFHMEPTDIASFTWGTATGYTHELEYEISRAGLVSYSGIVTKQENDAGNIAYDGLPIEFY